jgi:hypothetical protein
MICSRWTSGISVLSRRSMVDRSGSCRRILAHRRAEPLTTGDHVQGSDKSDGFATSLR